MYAYILVIYVIAVGMMLRPGSRGINIFCYKNEKDLLYIKTFRNFASGLGTNMRKVLFFIFVFLMSAVVTVDVAARRFTLVIDAGHGGHDAGAIGSFSKEKDINLKTALAFGRYVERNCPDVDVIYTRKTDVFVTLHGRADIANKAKADLFVSIHTNSLPGKRMARGLETYTLGMHRAADNFDVAKRENSVILVEQNYKERYQGFDPNSAESYIIFELLQDNNMQRSVEMAKLVQRNVCATALRPDKGVKQAGFLVLRETSMPSCLIELGFISTPDEEKQLNDEGHISNVAKGIYKAFIAYRCKFDDTTSAPRAMQETPQEEVSEPVPVKNKKNTTKTPEPENKENAPKEPRQDKTVKTVEPPVAPKETVPEPVKSDDRPIFKLQIFVSDRVLKAGDPHFKGRTDAQYYKEGNLLKYTLGASADYSEVYQLRKSVADKFPGCFIIAFKNGKKMNVNDAISEYRANKGK